MKHYGGSKKGWAFREPSQVKKGNREKGESLIQQPRLMWLSPLRSGLYMDSDIDCWRDATDMLVGYDIVLQVIWKRKIHPSCSFRFLSGNFSIMSRSPKLAMRQ